ncbi:hypothetical protein [Halobacteriovorax sp.]|uniref:hypothetical protein n=1 Tax=Halobacteriovorax sp. TaxID=2020862 RepID=UPI003AF2063C
MNIKEIRSFDTKKFKKSLRYKQHRFLISLITLLTPSLLVFAFYSYPKMKEFNNKAESKIEQRKQSNKKH